MHPALLVCIALLIPMVLFCTIVLPAYCSVILALYVQYGEQAFDLFFRFFLAIETYSKLLEYWQAHHESVDLVKFTLPTLGIPAIGCLVSLYSTYRLAMYVRNIFILTSP